MSHDFTPVPNEAMDALIARCLADDQSAWEEIVRTHRRKVFNVAYKFVGRHDEAEDLTQDIFIKIFKSRERTPLGELEQVDLKSLIRQALAELPATLRQAVTLRDLQEFSYQEIADQLGLPEGTVKSRINRGRLELARQIRRLQFHRPPGSMASRGGTE